MGDDIGVDADDAGVSVPDPGKAVGPKLLDMAGEVDGVAKHGGLVHHLGQAHATEVWTIVQAFVLTWNCGQQVNLLYIQHTALYI